MRKGGAEISADDVESALSAVEGISWGSRAVPAFAIKFPGQLSDLLGAVGESRMWLKHVEAIRPNPGLLNAYVRMPVMND